MSADHEVEPLPTEDRSRRAVPWWSLFAIPALLVAIVAGVAVAVVVAAAGGGGNDSRSHAAATGPFELDAVPEAIAVHYRYAEAHETELAAIPCFCGCEEFLAHRHLADCFLRPDGAGYEGHAAGCGVCIAEATVAAPLLDQGVPAADVAARIVEQFGSTPTTSPDQTIPRPT